MLGRVFRGLISRGLGRPCLVIIDGNKGLRAAVEKSWPGIKVQRCTVHKLRNLERHVPWHALEEAKSDYHRIINAESFDQGNKAYREFVVKWKKLAPKAVVSLEEVGEELLTFYGFPDSQWKSLRTTNVTGITFMILLAPQAGRNIPGRQNADESNQPLRIALRSRRRYFVRRRKESLLGLAPIFFGY
jgi:transposase-like protein